MVAWSCVPVRNRYGEIVTAGAGGDQAGIRERPGAGGTICWIQKRRSRFTPAGWPPCAAWVSGISQSSRRRRRRHTCSSSAPRQGRSVRCHLRRTVGVRPPPEATRRRGRPVATDLHGDHRIVPGRSRDQGRRDLRWRVGGSASAGRPVVVVEVVGGSVGVVVLVEVVVVGSWAPTESCVSATTIAATTAARAERAGECSERPNRSQLPGLPPTHHHGNGTDHRRWSG